MKRYIIILMLLVGTANAGTLEQRIALEPIQVWERAVEQQMTHMPARDGGLTPAEFWQAKTQTDRIPLTAMQVWDRAESQLREAATSPETRGVPRATFPLAYQTAAVWYQMPVVWRFPPRPQQIDPEFRRLFLEQEPPPPPQPPRTDQEIVNEFYAEHPDLPYRMRDAKVVAVTSAAISVTIPTLVAAPPDVYQALPQDPPDMMDDLTSFDRLQWYARKAIYLGLLSLAGIGVWQKRQHEQRKHRQALIELEQAADQLLKDE